MFAVAALMALVTCGSGLRADEFLCEEAFAHLRTCCPSFAVTSSNYCTYSVGCGETQYPALTAADSNCIIRMSCTDIVANDVCNAASERVVRIEQTSGPSSPNGPPPATSVCR